MVARLEKISISGFKTIKEIKNLELRPLNVLIGPNGAGKSNLLSFFNLARAFQSVMGGFRSQVARMGGAHRLLHEGPKVTQQIQWRLEMADPDGAVSGYPSLGCHTGKNGSVGRVRRFNWELSLISGPEDELEPSEGRIEIEAENGKLSLPTFYGSDLFSTILKVNHWVDIGDPFFIVDNAGIFQLHDTSATSRIKQRWDMEDCLGLKMDGGNLAPFLYRLRRDRPEYYLRIASSVRAVVPFFDDFVLQPLDNSLLLRWKERDSDLVFGPSQASDGMLRIFVLAALLLQPEENLPPLIIVDEPELGLHPYAVELIAGLFKAAAVHTQIILATQSVNFVDQFDPQDIVVVDRVGRESFFRRLDPGELEDWLQDYTVSELWEKNVIGGRSVR